MIVPRPPKAKRIVRCKWIFKVKHTPNGTTKHKARLCAMGFTHREGEDFNETFAPVARFTSLRMILSFGVGKDLIMGQSDISTAFLNASLDEEIYMELPEGLEKSDNSVCRLQKALYGLKQSPRMWHETIKEWLV